MCGRSSAGSVTPMELPPGRRRCSDRVIEAKGAGVRQEWSPEELLANWTLVDGDWDLVANKSGTTRLGFSLLLKSFELEGRFPDVLEEVPRAAVEYLADLVKLPATDFPKHTLVGRTAKYHRKQIREALGFRPSTVSARRRLLACRSVGPNGGRGGGGWVRSGKRRGISGRRERAGGRRRLRAGRVWRGCC
ncbi:DUF4158 domain-containing protein [Streptomyces sp. NPDC014006]|uniref:DUF4158 domain-containing protein n=1 Tax=Streptomyces sp. NPDC014006 TaxID=3364870 RepID=UPI0036F7E0F7